MTACTSINGAAEHAWRGQHRALCYMEHLRKKFSCDGAFKSNSPGGSFVRQQNPGNATEQHFGYWPEPSPDRISTAAARGQMHTSNGNSLIAQNTLQEQAQIVLRGKDLQMKQLRVCHGVQCGPG